jgi:hypothetical protein
MAVLLLAALTAVLYRPIPPASAAVRCGSERWGVKTLSDPRADEVDFSPRDTTVARLRRLSNPGVGSDDPRTAPVEFRTYRVRARLKLAKKEEDRDIHLVIGAPSAPRKTMIVEFPMVRCQGAASSIKKGAMRRARHRLLTACGDIGSSSFKQLHGIARITGVGFWDINHGQTGIAPNAIELHPVLRFEMLQGTCQ